MRLTRLFLDQPLAVGTSVELDERAHRHAVQVLRLRPGAELILFNGTGGEYRAELVQAGKRHSLVAILGHDNRSTRPRLTITLVQGVSRGDRMDYALQKATELGVTGIQPVITRRSQVSDDPRRQESRHEHWRGVIISACEQCGRNDLPELHAIRKLDEWLADWSGGTGLVLDPQASQGLTGMTADNPVSLLIGPEGGLLESEISAARHIGYQAVHLGPRILRTETAGVAALAVIQALWGDLS